MTSLLLDTHTWAWAVTADERLSANAATLIEAADRVFVSPISVFEIAQKVQSGRWPEMASYLDVLAGLVEERGGSFAALSAESCKLAATLEWDHGDPFDRLLAATAINFEVPLLSKDKAFDRLAGRNGWIARLW